MWGAGGGGRLNVLEVRVTSLFADGNIKLAGNLVEKFGYALNIFFSFEALP